MWVRVPTSALRDTATNRQSDAPVVVSLCRRVEAAGSLCNHKPSSLFEAHLHPFQSINKYVHLLAQHTQPALRCVLCRITFVSIELAFRGTLLEKLAIFWL